MNGQWYVSIPCTNPATCYCPVPVVDPPDDDWPVRLETCIPYDEVSIDSHKQFWILLSTEANGANPDSRFKFYYDGTAAKFDMATMRVVNGSDVWLITAHYDSGLNQTSASQTPEITKIGFEEKYDYLYINYYNAASPVGFLHTESENTSTIKFGDWSLDIVRVFP